MKTDYMIRFSMKSTEMNLHADHVIEFYSINENAAIALTQYTGFIEFFTLLAQDADFWEYIKNAWAEYEGPNYEINTSQL